jgi:Uma2 family endonuclease
VSNRIHGNVPEYWVIDVSGRAVEVYDEPTGGRYARVRRYSTEQSVAPAAFPDLVLSVSDPFVGS